MKGRIVPQYTDTIEVQFHIRGLPILLLHRWRRYATLLLVLATAVSLASSDDDQPAQQSEGQKLIGFLNQTIVWYRDFNNLQQWANESSDVVFLNDNRGVADEVVRLAFDYARTRAQVIASTESATPTPALDANSAGARYQGLLARAAKSEQQLKQAQAAVEEIRNKWERATGKQREYLVAALAEAQSEVGLIQTRRDVLKSMVSFLSSGKSGVSSLPAQIEELARTVPVASPEDSKGSSNQKSSTPAPAATTTAKHAEPSGILGLISDLIGLRHKIDSLEGNINETDRLAEASKGVRTPLVQDLKALVAKGDELANAPATTDPDVLLQQKQAIDGLNSQFKKLSGSVLPLGKQGILLDVYKRTLSSWRDSVAGQYRAELKGLILRLVILGLLIGVIVAISEIWRRATFRYIQDVRRRYQFLLLRRIVIWIVIAIVVASAFASELGTLATFAGLLTAGIAVALQNVILSVAGYFFLIGKYGVRVGDRVQIAGVTGDVIDIGLVRLHIMEVLSEGSDARPTGRAVVFSNSVVFQPNAGIFKQIPGTNFVWHEITLTLAAESKYLEVEKRLMDAVQAVYSEYKPEMETQRRRMEQSLKQVSVKELTPDSRVRLTQSGLEVVIRYPVELSNAAVIDDQMARALLEAISKEPRLRLVGTGTPNIQAVAEPHPAV